MAHVPFCHQPIDDHPDFKALVDARAEARARKGIGSVTPYKAPPPAYGSITLTPEAMRASQAAENAFKWRESITAWLDSEDYARELNEALTPEQYHARKRPSPHPRAMRWMATLCGIVGLAESSAVAKAKPVRRGFQVEYCEGDYYEVL